MGTWENGRWGFIDKLGDWVIRPTWNRALGFRGGVSPVMKGSMDGGLWGCIDSVGNVVVETSYELAMPFFDGLGFVQDSEHRWGYVDRTGKFVWEPVK